MPDGRVPNFWIQDVPPELDEQIVDFMCDSFLKEENMLSITKVREDPESYESIRMFWHHMLGQRIAIVAFSDWPNGESSPTIAGCNITGVELKGHSYPKFPGDRLQKVVAALEYIEHKVDVFERYGADACMTALGLSVSPLFRGQELGRELLLAREPLARAVGLKFTVTVFTGIASQKQSERAGFELLAEQKYTEYKPDGEEVFPGAPCETFQLKAKHYP